jgi:hypothetical protein
MSKVKFKIGKELKNLKLKSHPNLKEDHYYYSQAGFLVYTEAYHLDRGYCCKSDCRHCPWKDKEKALLA